MSVVHAPAKINLTLEILGLAPTGFHDLRSVMIDLDLADELAVEVTPDAMGIALRVAPSDPLVPSDGRNLVVRAARAFLEARGSAMGLSFALRKRIPTEGGLGGGSADAAAALRALEAIRGLGIGDERLLAVAASIGSDVPFALRGGAAMAEGRGERLTPLAHPRPLWVVLVRPPVSVSTPWCYRRWDEMFLGRPRERRDHAPLTDALARGDAIGVARNMFNDLMAPVLDAHPQLAAIPRELVDGGCAGAQMTGSGSCFYGIAPSRQAARQAAARVRRRNLGRVWVTRTAGEG